ncbi:MAG: GvpL/GvpF family gas vesicle protein [Planctomycetota bacterium]|nr:GvpL/GvpF family gas vesicle protein [Planctomycetota bacterium]
MTLLTPTLAASDPTTATRQYIYCIVNGDSSAGLEAPRVENAPELLTVCHEGVAAVVSATDSERLEISRGNALTHQRVMEAVMRQGRTVLPVRFNTIAEPKGPKTAQQRLIDHVLVGRRDEMLELLAGMASLVELSVKGLWGNMETVFKDLVESDSEIRSLRQKLLAPPRVGQKKPVVNRATQVKLGERVKTALEARKAKMEEILLARVRGLAVDSRRNRTFGDAMFANLALLVDKSRQEDVTAALTEFQAHQDGRVNLRCVGPLPPSNFLELVISWDD